MAGSPQMGSFRREKRSHSSGTTAFGQSDILTVQYEEVGALCG